MKKVYPVHRNIAIYPRDFEEVTHSDDAPMLTVIMAHPRISNFVHPNIWHICNIQSKMGNHGICILLKSIQKLVSSSNSSLKVALHNTVRNCEHRCVLGCLSHKEIDQSLNIMTHYVQDTKIATWQSNSGVTWQTSGSHASRPRLPPPPFLLTPGMPFAHNATNGTENGSFGRNTALMSESYTTNTDWHTWKYQSVTCRLNFFS